MSINTPRPPLMSSLQVSMQLAIGTNQILRNVGGYRMNYRVSAGNPLVNNQTIVLEPGRTFVSDPGEIYQVLVVNTETPVVLAGSVVGGSALNVVVNTLFMLDSPLASFMITNAGTAPTQVTLTTVAISAVAEGSADFSDVNNGNLVATLSYF